MGIRTLLSVEACDAPETLSQAGREQPALGPGSGWALWDAGPAPPSAFGEQQIVLAPPSLHPQEGALVTVLLSPWTLSLLQDKVAHFSCPFSLEAILQHDGAAGESG